MNKEELLSNLNDLLKQFNSSNLEEDVESLKSFVSSNINRVNDQKAKTKLKAQIDSNEFTVDKIENLLQLFLDISSIEKELTESQNIITQLKQTLNKKTNSEERQKTNNLIKIEQDKIDVLKIKYGAKKLKEKEREFKHLNKTKNIVLTEDENTEMIQSILKSNSFNENETKIITYKGIKNNLFHNSIELIHHLSPWSKIIVHRDRDYMSKDEIDKLQKDSEELRFYLFVTKGYDIESYFFNPKHIIELNDFLNINDVYEMYTKTIEETEEVTIKKMKNSDLNLDDLTSEYKKNPLYYIYSKVALKIFISKLNLISNNRGLTIIAPSKYLIIENLKNDVLNFNDKNN